MMSGTEQPMLVVRGISKTFGRLVALNNVSFNVEQGQIRGLIGPNGSGKSTIFNLISGFLNPDNGSVLFQGTDVTSLAPHRIAAMGLVRTFQLTSLYQDYTVFKNIWLGCHLTRMVRKTTDSKFGWTVDSLLEYFDLESCRDAPAYLLPDGTQKIVSLAVAVATEPSLLLLDEPLAGLNPSEKIEVAKKIRNLNEKGMAVLLVEHDVKSVMSLCDRVSVINFGEIIAEGEPGEIVSNDIVIEAYLGRPGEFSAAN